MIKEAKKKIVITGIGNIGFSLVKKLNSSKLELIIVVISRRLPAYFKEYLNKLPNGTIDFIKADVTNQEDLAKISKDEKLKNIDVVVSTVGFQSTSNDFIPFKNDFNGNLYSNLSPVKSFLNNIPKNANSRIIIISSTSGNKAPKIVNAYAPSKFALENFSGSLQQELNIQKIFVDIIRPTNIINQFSQSFRTKRGIPADTVSEKIFQLIELNYYGRSKQGIKQFIPNYFLGVRILERVFPSVLNFLFKVKPEFIRRKIYKNYPIHKILITGGSSGLGRELAYLYSNHVKEIIITGRDESKLFKVKNDIHNGSECKVSTIKIDFDSLEEVETLSNNITDIDLLINNAGQYLSKSIEDTTIGEYEKIMNINFLSAVLITQNLLKTTNVSKVINILSTTAICGSKYHSAYSASKSALWAYTRSLRRQYGNKIQIMEVIPSTFSSNLFRQSRSKDNENIIKKNLMDPIIVAKKIFSAERSGKDLIFYSF